MESNTNKQVIISPFSRPTHLTNKPSPKDFPKDYWKVIIDDLRAKGVKTIQIGVEGEDDLGCNNFIKGAAPSELLVLLKNSDLFLAIDNFLPHFAYFYKFYHGIVLFGQSNPQLFGYNEYTNLFVDKKYFRVGREQYRYYEDCKYIKEAFVEPNVVLNEIYKKLSLNV